MKKIKAFYYIYKNSLLNPSYYKDVVKEDLKLGFKYFAALAFFATLITTLRVVIPVIPEAKESINSSLDGLVRVYPEDLVIKVENGQWSINHDEPFIFPSPESIDTEEIDFPKNFLVLDHEGTINSMEELDTLILFNSTNMLIADSTGKIDVFPLDGLPDGEFTYTKLSEIIGRLRTVAAYSPILIFGFVLLSSTTYYFAFRLLFLVTVTWIILIAGKIIRSEYKFSEYFKIALHTFTLPLTIEVALALAGVIIGIPLWFLVINVSFSIFILIRLKKGGRSNNVAETFSEGEVINK